MSTIPFDSKRTLTIAHRGLSGLETENTNAAFVAAGNRSYYGIETDIRRTADGDFILVHDGDLTRVAGESITVEEANLSTLQSIVLYDRDGSKSRSDLRPSTLENYIAICKKYQKACILELKNDFTDQEIRSIIQRFRDGDYLEHVIFISFKYNNLLKVRKAVAKQPVQLLCDIVTDEIIHRLAANGIDCDAYYHALTKDIIDRLHELGRQVNCWTVDDADSAQRLAEWGVDYITTNILE